jgi:hypothetical protein
MGGNNSSKPSIISYEDAVKRSNFPINLRLLWLSENQNTKREEKVIGISNFPRIFRTLTPFSFVFIVKLSFVDFV